MCMHLDVEKLHGSLKWQSLLHKCPRKRHEGKRLATHVCTNLCLKCPSHMRSRVPLGLSLLANVMVHQR